MRRLVKILDLMSLGRSLGIIAKPKSPDFVRWKDEMDNARDGICRDSVFLIDDFREAVLIPQCSNDRNFSAHYGSYAQDFDNFFERLKVSSSNIEVPFAEVSEGPAKRYKLAKLQGEMEAHIQEVIELHRNDSGYSFSLDWGGEDFPEYKFRELYMNAAQESATVDAVHLDDLANYLVVSGFMKYEDKLIDTGQAETVLGFWQAVQNLRSYGEPIDDDDGGHVDRSLTLEPAYATLNA